MYFITFLTNIKKNSFYTKYRQYKFSKLVKVAKFSINRWLHLYFSLKLHNIQNEHFSVSKKCKKCFKFNGNVLFCHYGSILDSDKSCNPGRRLHQWLENWPEKIWSSISFLLLNIGESGKISTTQNLDVPKSPWLHHWLPAPL